jgi:hypothetical protein
MRNSYPEQIFSALPPKADSSRTSGHDRFGSEVANVRFGSLGKSFLTFLHGCGHVPALLVRDARTRQKLACCRYQSLVLYLLVQRG